jgi:GTP-binding protein
MPIPRVAIVGRPNVGKSSIMNMIAGAKVSIVDPTPGVTRDRVAAIVELLPPYRDSGEPKTVEFMDTGGFGVYVAEGGRFDEVGNDLQKLTGSIEFQIQQAVEGADLILFCVDAQAGVTPHDRQIAQLLRQGGFKRDNLSGDERKKNPPVKVVATKVDGPKWESHAMELAELGFGEPLLVSAKVNYMRRDFMDQVFALVPKLKPTAEEQARADLMVAIIGKRNAGKSTLINTLAGEQRVIASEIPGTTRDAIDVRFEMDGKSIVAIDTAGLRKKKSFQNMIEHFAFDRVQRSVDRADVVILLLDAVEKISQVDEQLAMLAQKSFKPCIIVVNKWDLAQGQRNHKGQLVTPAVYEKYIRDQLRGLWFAPISFISGSSGKNVRATMQLALELKEQSAARVTTGKLNRMVRDIVNSRGPSDDHGRFAKVYFVAQTGVEPPTITMVVNHPEMFTPNYLRFLSNRFREELPFAEVPMRIVVRERRQREDDLVAAEEGGEGNTIRVTKGRKGVTERLGGRRVEALSDEDDAWLNDEHSKAFETPFGGEVNDEGFVPEESGSSTRKRGGRDHTADDDGDDDGWDGDAPEPDRGTASASGDEFDDEMIEQQVPAAASSASLPSGDVARKPKTAKAGKKVAKPVPKKPASKPMAKAAKKPAVKVAKKAAKKAAKKTTSKPAGKASTKAASKSTKKSAKRAK